MFATETDAEGQYRLYHLPEDSYEVTTRASGYLTQVSTTSTSIETPVITDFSLARGGTISGQVLSAGGEPVNEAQII